MISGTFLGPLNILGFQSGPSKVSVILESNKLIFNSWIPCLTITFLIFGLILNSLVCLILWKYSRTYLPLLTFLVYILALDQIVLILYILDLIVEFCYDIRLLMSIQILTRFSCQISHLIYNSIQHLRSFLIIVLAIWTCKLCHKPWNYLAQFNLQTAQNIFILIITLVLITNCQFLWTFDLIQIHSLILHNRTVKHVFKCDWCSDAQLSQIYLTYIWPLIDHLTGEIGPCLVCILAGPWILKINNQLKEEKKKKEHHHQNKHYDDSSSSNKVQNKELELLKWLDLDIIYHIVKSIGLICLIHGLCLLCKCGFYMFKYTFLFGKLKIHLCKI